MQSLTWRRRSFHLLGHELRMYKSDAPGETDKTPLQTASLVGAIVSQTYEESQVRASWKLGSGTGQVSDRLGGNEEAFSLRRAIDVSIVPLLTPKQEFFMFADSPEDKDTILEGLTIAIE
jgi:hypothetical protein